MQSKWNTTDVFYVVCLAEIKEIKNERKKSTTNE